MTLHTLNQQENNNVSIIFGEMDELRNNWWALLIPKIKKIFWEKTYGYDIERIALDLFDKLYAQYKENTSKPSTVLVEFLPSNHWGISWINESHQEIRNNIISAGGSTPSFTHPWYKLHLGDNLYVSLNGNWIWAYGVEKDIADNKLLLTFTYAPDNKVTQKEILSVFQ
jgi:hypothetical protein